MAFFHAGLTHLSICLYAFSVYQAIRGMKLSEARRYLQEVVDKRKPVPYRRHKKEVPHKAGLEGWYAGRYPVKAARGILKIMNNLEANAYLKGLDVESVRIIHAAAHRARKIRGYIPRAFGRSSPSHKKLCHVELIVEEMG